MSGAFVNPLARGMPGVVRKARQIKDWTRNALSLTDEGVVSVNELSCHLPGCPPKETAILVMQQGETRQVSIHKAMSEVTKDDVEYAFAASEAGSK
ncbi:hypothetical protein PZN02_005448 [Sinorhizobium garamanticum]|uniref:Uncharacterized protein n=1 Tax=Sinorhizobium garamanticum TaxID=680247 RepID=A0ABY8DGS2_9HYPH|nr:hypothetical protein [Sinorhizobium garamanticum]WEX90094.1 hypothetical protein PZN02_005448 [Sinorhizobium garamanticum]